MRFDFDTQNTPTNIEPKAVSRRIKHELKLLKLQTDCEDTIDNINKSLKWLRDIKARLLAN
jgi:hypothetical protein